MKFTYLGTSSCEGVPAVFCNCKNCRRARELGGKNIRTRSQALINYDLLLDFPADSYHHFLVNNIEGHKIKYLFLTHSRSDHFYIDDLFYHAPMNAHDMQSERIKAYLTAGALEKVRACGETLKNVEIYSISPYDVIELPEYKVTALPARHMSGDGAVIYIIETDKTVLYAHDTGYLTDDVIRYIAENRIRFDMVSYDCAYVGEWVDDSGNHMGIDNCLRLKRHLESIGAADGDTIHYISHLSHNAAPFQEELEEKLAPYGFLVAYDGLAFDL